MSITTRSSGTPRVCSIGLRKTRTDGNLEKAGQSLNQYLSLKPDDSAAWKRYAQLLDDLYAEEPRRREQVLLVYQEALRHNLDDVKLERRCLDLALEFGTRHKNEAKTHLDSLLARITKESKGPEKAELEELYGDYHMLESRVHRGGDSVQGRDHRRPDEGLRLQQTGGDSANTTAAGPSVPDAVIDEMVKKNPKSGEAHLNRFRYDSEFRPSKLDEQQ